MIDYNNLLINRMIMHTINVKLDTQDHATAVHETDLLDRSDNEVITVIKTRLIDAAGKSSKAFELKFDNTGDDSFYALCHLLKNKTDAEFIRFSQEAADWLAESQTRSNIPGGYLLVMDCLDEFSETAVYIFIKAEPHEALRRVEGQSQISLVNKVFLSPSQKLYKIGIVYEKESPVSDDPNDQYGCFLFDDQFRQMSHPAEYFYKDFLGFTVSENDKIQSQRFYEKTERFIKEKISDVEQKADLLRALRLVFTIDQNSVINPAQFGQTYLPTAGLRGEYIDEIVHELPNAIVKDDTLLKTKLNRRKIDFPNNINIIGPGEAFDDKVRILNHNQLGDLDLLNNEYTLVRIQGKPYSYE